MKTTALCLTCLALVLLASPARAAQAFVHDAATAAPAPIPPRSGTFRPWWPSP